MCASNYFSPFRISTTGYPEEYLETHITRSTNHRNPLPTPLLLLSHHIFQSLKRRNTLPSKDSQPSSHRPPNLSHLPTSNPLPLTPSLLRPSLLSPLNPLHLHKLPTRHNLPVQLISLPRSQPPHIVFPKPIPNPISSIRIPCMV